MKKKMMKLELNKESLRQLDKRMPNVAAGVSGLHPQSCTCDTNSLCYPYQCY
jgi:hypothetical protein